MTCIGTLYTVWYDILYRVCYDMHRYMYTQSGVTYYTECVMTCIGTCIHRVV